MTMTMSDTVGRIAQIQNTLTQLSRPAASASGAASATAFANALSTTTEATSTTTEATSATTAAAAPGALAASAGSADGTDVVEAAKKYLGVPYVFGGEDANGVDCSGLIQRVFKDMGMDVPRLVSGQSTLGTEVASLKDAKPGDLIVNDNGGHISIYLGDNKILYAPKPGDKVKINEIYFPESEIVTIRRLVPSETPAVSASRGAASSDLATAALRSALAGSTS